MNTSNVLVSVVAAPGVLFLTVAGLWLLGAKLKERWIAHTTAALFAVMSAAAVWLDWILDGQGLQEAVWSGGEWFRVGSYEFTLKLVADQLSLPLITLTCILTGLVGFFSARYLHREGGFLRFFLLLHLFAFGSLLLFSAGSLDLLIGGWELVGITSVLLIAFFQQRRDPVRNALHVFGAYKIGDLGLLLGVFVLHYFAGSAEVSHLFGGEWPVQSANMNSWTATLAGLLFLFAAAAKSAQFPFSGWLARAMEGPTPSSAIFYGALSIHAGAYLLLRMEPVWSASLVARVALVAVGAFSAISGTLIHRVASDAKTSIAYAAVTQLGIIFIEIALGLPRLALLHMIGHAVVRTMQFLRAPSMLHDYHRVHAAAGGHLTPTGKHFENAVPSGVRAWAYRFALDRGFYDALVRFAVGPVLALARQLSSLEPASRSREAAAPARPSALEQGKWEDSQA